jgi:hypothetical protein
MRRDYFTLGSPRWNEKAIFSPALYTILVFLFYIRLGCRAAVGDVCGVVKIIDSKTQSNAQ